MQNEATKSTKANDNENKKQADSEETAKEKKVASANIANKKQPDGKPSATVSGKQTKPASKQEKGEEGEPKSQIKVITDKFLKTNQEYNRQSELLAKRITSTKANIERLESQLTKYELQYSQLKQPSIIDEMVKPLVDELLKMMNDEFTSYDLIGPMGLQESVTITFSKEDDGKIANPKCENSRSITFVTKPEEDGIGIRDYSKDTGIYSPGSISYASGMNHPVVMLPDDVDLKWILAWIK